MTSVLCCMVPRIYCSCVSDTLDPLTTPLLHFSPCILWLRLTFCASFGQGREMTSSLGTCRWAGVSIHVTRGWQNVKRTGQRYQVVADEIIRSTKFIRSNLSNRNNEDKWRPLVNLTRAFVHPLNKDYCIRLDWDSDKMPVASSPKRKSQFLWLTVLNKHSYWLGCISASIIFQDHPSVI